MRALLSKVVTPRCRLTCALLLGVVSCDTSDRYTRIIDVEPIVIAELRGQAGEPDFEAMKASYQNFGPVHAMTYYGDFDEFVDGHHKQILQYFANPDASLEQRRNCSMFQYGRSIGRTVVGRNYDNVFTELLVGWFYPVNGYASITFIPLSELGFNEERKLSADNEYHRHVLLNGPIVSIEGMNEKGVTVTLASLDRRTVEQMPEKEPRFLIHLVREILDHAADLDEAVEIASRYNVFDNGREIISHHIFIADPRSGSVVLEWKDGLMHVVPDGENWQIVTNSDLLEISEEQRRKSCDRYDTIYKRLYGHVGPLQWTEAMDALGRAAQNNRLYVIDGRRLRVSTQWSAIFDLESREALVCLHRDFERVYRFRL